MLATKSDPKALDAGVDSLDGTELILMSSLKLYQSY